MRAALLLCAGLLVAALSTVSAQGPLRGEVAFAAPASPSPSPDAASDAGCATPCFVVEDYYPYRTCKAECNQQICSRSVAFPEGCSQRPSECWVVESFNLRTCIRDDRKCLQGYGVYPNEQTCCAPGAAFPEGCATNLTQSPEPCWVVDAYYPARTCRATRTACDTRGQTWPTSEACCAPQSGAFGEGCSTYVPKAPCYVIDSYNPVRKCRLENDIARCSRGWGVFQSAEVCCAPGAAFTEGCTQPPSDEAAASAAAPPAPAAAAPAAPAAAAPAAPEAAAPAAPPPAEPAAAAAPAVPTPALAAPAAPPVEPVRVPPAQPAAAPDALPPSAGRRR
ncbi:hypothetical protein MNEG_10297 [Monoraphidium neglectum]|uniref:Uncharacterized protein n=1 Tax=Monoraphidium neglectum TaxID=145388 RepID=A0A0D2JDS3_9CHLO|nr:hypothetical protein MNEG_10297 [Monoraphidium neglectum]KIY97667.1 hypothetical protein MNEG_10297 [Monoraphidium neglectum]|eukprot:XP_013896687.1 hypothetical protein MNEG_10297 [Monoraphidium neglectum]